MVPELTPLEKLRARAEAAEKREVGLESKLDLASVRVSSEVERLVAAGKIDAAVAGEVRDALKRALEADLDPVHSHVLNRLQRQAATAEDRLDRARADLREASDELDAVSAALGSTRGDWSGRRISACVADRLAEVAAGRALSGEVAPEVRGQAAKDILRRLDGVARNLWSDGSYRQAHALRGALSRIRAQPGMAVAGGPGAPINWRCPKCGDKLERLAGGYGVVEVGGEWAHARCAQEPKPILISSGRIILKAGMDLLDVRAGDTLTLDLGNGGVVPTPETLVALVQRQTARTGA